MASFPALTVTLRVGPQTSVLLGRYANGEVFPGIDIFLHERDAEGNIVDLNRIFHLTGAQVIRVQFRRLSDDGIPYVDVILGYTVIEHGNGVFASEVNLRDRTVTSCSLPVAPVFVQDVPVDFVFTDEILVSDFSVDLLPQPWIGNSQPTRPPYLVAGTTSGFSSSGPCFFGHAALGTGFTAVEIQRYRGPVVTVDLLLSEVVITGYSLESQPQGGLVQTLDLAFRNLGSSATNAPDPRGWKVP